MSIIALPISNKENILDYSRRPNPIIRMMRFYHINTQAKESLNPTQNCELQG